MTNFPSDVISHWFSKVFQEKMVGKYFSKYLVMNVTISIIFICFIKGGILLKIQSFSFPTQSIVGTRVSVSCTPAIGEKMEFQWLFNGRELTKGSNVDIRSYSDLSTLVIDPLSEEDSGNYTCVVRARSNTAQYTTTLEVLVPPSWKQVPRDIDVSSGDTVILNCKGSGAPTPSAAWWKAQGKSMDYVPVTDSEMLLQNGTLKLNSVTKEDEGFYKCNVSNGIGSPLTKTVVVRVTGGESLKIQPFSFPTQSIIGDRVSATCTPAIGEKIEFQWLRNGRELTKGSNVDIRAYPDLSNLVIDPLSEGDSGNYTCVVRVRGITAQYTAALEVLVPPSWKQVPHDVDASSGESVFLDCSGSGTPNPSATWWKAQGQNMDYIAVVDSEMFLQNGTLKLSSVTKEDEGLYKCSVSNEIGSPLTKTIVVRVTDANALEIQPFSFPVNAAIGQRVSVTCTPLTGERLEFTWLYNGREIPRVMQNVNVVSFPLLSSLIIDPLTPDDSGNYTCRVINTRGLSGFHTTTLDVLEPPSWILTPTDTDARSGDSLVLHCKGSGKPEPVTTWSRTKSVSSDFILVSDTERVTIHPNGSLFIGSVVGEDEGAYRCRVSNGVGTTLFKTVSLKVIGSDTLKIQPFDFPSTSVVGKRVTTTCAITTSAKVDFKWLKNGGEVRPDSRTIVRSFPEFSTLIIDPLSEEDNGNYTCLAHSEGISDSHMTHLEVLVPPTWRETPADVDAVDGESIFLPCSGSGRPHPSTSWSRATGSALQYTPLSTSEEYELFKNGSLTFRSIHKKDEGLYKCVLSNGIGSQLIQMTHVKVIGTPKVQKFFFPDQVVSGTKTSVMCTAISGSPPLEFNWLRNGQPVRQIADIVINTYSEFSVLLLEGVNRNSSGNYTCELTGPTGSDSFTTVLDVKEPPKWSKVPGDLSVHSGATISLECEATGHPSPDVTWKKLSEGFRDRSETVVDEIKSPGRSVLQVQQVSSNNAGLYECVADNGISSIKTNVIMITVSAPPKIQPFNLAKQYRTGEKVTLFCAIKSGTPPFTFHWTKDGQKSVTGADVVQLKEFSSLILHPLTLESRGNYTCQASNSYGSNSHTEFLNVVVPPKWVIQPKDQEVVDGEDLSVECAADGHPTPRITWKKQEDQKTRVGENVLRIEGATEEDEGRYVCSAINDVDNGISHTILISVLVPARFEEKFTMQTVRRGETSTLKCEAAGDKTLTITWLKDKAEIDFKKHTRLEKFDRDTDKGLSSELIIRTSDRKDGALYGCLAKNEYGSDERNVKLLVVEVPAQPMDVKVKEVWSRTASIVWSAPYSGNSAITKYIIQYWRDRGGPHRLLEDTIPSTQNTVLLKNLQPGTPYVVTVLGENEIGQGPPSDALKFITGEEEPDGPPTDVWIEAKSSSSILVTWKPPPRDLWNGELRGYYVGYKVEGSSHPYSFKMVDNAANESQEYVLNTLMKSTKYNIIVKAYNSAGTGPQSQDLVAKTLDGDVPEAPDFTVVAASESKISLRWGDPPSRSVPVTGYTLHYKREGGEWNHVPIIASSSKNRFTITGLESSTPYKIYITASNQYGNGDPSDLTTVTTSMKGFVIGSSETYVDLSVIVPVAACILAFIVVAVVVVIYYKKSKARNNLERALQGGKPFPYTASTQRYIDIDKTRLPAEPGTLGSSYATIPGPDGLEEPTQEMKAFMHGNMKDRPLPSKPSSMKRKKSKGHVYDTAQ